MAAILDRISTLNDMKLLMLEFKRLEAKFLFEYYGALQDFSSKNVLSQWLSKKNIKQVFISEKGNEILTKVSNSTKRCIIIYDLETPDLNGLQFIAALEKNPELKSRCKVILATPRLNAEAHTKLTQLINIRATTSKPLEAELLGVAFEKVGITD